MNKLLTKVTDWTFLSQNLTGFCQHLIMNRTGTTRPPQKNNDDDTDYPQLIGKQYQYMPDIFIGDEDPNMTTHMTSPNFFLARAGYFELSKLWLVDAFGQKIDLLKANKNVDESGSTSVDEHFIPIRPGYLLPTKPELFDEPYRQMQLSPRIVQPARLDFDWLSNIDSVPADLIAGGNPVCGWLLPNHLDSSIAVYDAEGNPLGQLGAGPKDKVVSWSSSPGALIPIDTAEQISNPTLRNVISGITQFGQDSDLALSNLLEVIDETLWAVDPLGSRGDQNLSVLIGRPIAVARARLRFTVGGLAISNQAWNATPDDHGGVLDLQIQVKIGSVVLREDGALGYFIDGVNADYSKFYAVHNAIGTVAAKPPYICPIHTNADSGGSSNFLMLPVSDEKAVGSNPKSVQDAKDVTLLLDPRGKVHLSTGLLPVKSVELPTQYYEQVLTEMKVSFRTGPLLVENDAFRIPRPVEQHGKWTWHQQSAQQQWKSGPVVNVDDRARLPDTPATIWEGWLALSPDNRSPNDEDKP